MGKGVALFSMRVWFAREAWVLGLGTGFSVLGTRFWVQGQGSQCWVLGSGLRDWVLSAGYEVLGSGTGFSVLGNIGSGFRDWVRSAGFSVLGTRFWVQGQGSQCWVLSAGY